MESARIYTRKIMGMDKNVWYVLLAAIILPLGLLGYRSINKKECFPVEFTMKSVAQGTNTIFTTNEIISFKAASLSDNITWDFGDKSGNLVGSAVIHRFKTPGDYFVTVSTGMGCDNKVHKVKIVPPVQTIETSSTEIITGSEIAGPNSAMAGSEVVFICMVSANSYEWTIPGFPKMVQTGASAKITFPSGGTYTVQVTLNGDRSKRYTKEIIVEKKEENFAAKSTAPIDPKPLVPYYEVPPQQQTVPDPVVINEVPKKEPEEVVKPRIISEATFRDFMQKVVEGEYKVSHFDKYLCNGGNTQVMMNKEKVQKNFNTACQELDGKKTKDNIFSKRKRVKITNIRWEKDSEGCITLLHIFYD